jgi:hypothetical protein
MYSAPFILVDAASGNSFTQLAFFFSPYELIGSELLSYISLFRFEDLTYIMKMQLFLEQNLPDFQLCRNLHKALLINYALVRKTGYGGLITIPTICLIRYLPLLMNKPAETSNMGTTIVPVDTGMDDGTNIILKIIN